MSIPSGVSVLGSAEGTSLGWKKGGDFVGAEESVGLGETAGSVEGVLDVSNISRNEAPADSPGVTHVVVPVYSGTAHGS